VAFFYSHIFLLLFLICFYPCRDFPAAEEMLVRALKKAEEYFGTSISLCLTPVVIPTCFSLDNEFPLPIWCRHIPSQGWDCFDVHSSHVSTESHC